MAQTTTVILTKDNPVGQTTDADRLDLINSRTTLINVATRDPDGLTVENTGTVTGKWKGVGAHKWDDFKESYSMHSSTNGGGWQMGVVEAEYMQFDATGYIPTDHTIEITIRTWGV